MKSKFTYDEKREILERYISRSESPTNIIKSVGISKSTFYKWLYDHQQEQAKSKIKELTLRNFTLLEAKVKRLEGIIEIIKKTNVLPSSPLQQKLHAAEKLFGEYSVHMICEALDITRSFSRPYVPYDNSVIESFFASLKREELYRKKYRTENELLQAIEDYMKFYNTRRPHAKIQYKTPEQKEREYYAIFEVLDDE